MHCPNTLVCIDAPYTHTCTTKHKCMQEMHQIHIHAPQCTTKHKCVHRCTIYTCAAHEHMFTTCITKHICAPPKHHPKIKIYLVSIPSALYERPGQNERYVLNSALLLLFRCFSYEKHILGAFHEKCIVFFMKSILFTKAQVLFTKSAGAFHEKCRCFS